MLNGIEVKIINDGVDGISVDLEALNEGQVAILNVLLDKTRQFAVTALAKRYNLEISAFENAITLTQATKSNLDAKITVRGPRQFLSIFARGQESAGTAVEVIRGRVYVDPHTFLRVMRSGHKGVFYRGEAKNRRRKSSMWTKGRAHTSSPNLPIDEEYRISVPEMFASFAIMTDVEEFVTEVADQIIDTELEKHLH